MLKFKFGVVVKTSNKLSLE